MCGRRDARQERVVPQRCVVSSGRREGAERKREDGEPMIRLLAQRGGCDASHLCITSCRTSLHHYERSGEHSPARVPDPRAHGGRQRMAAKRENDFCVVLRCPYRSPGATNNRREPHRGSNGTPRPRTEAFRLRGLWAHHQRKRAQTLVSPSSTRVRRPTSRAGALDRFAVAGGGAQRRRI